MPEAASAWLFLPLSQPTPSTGETSAGSHCCRRASGSVPSMLQNEVLLCFAFYSTILIVKMFVVAIITGQVRLRKKVRVTFLLLLLPFCFFLPLLGFLWFLLLLLLLQRPTKVFLQQAEFALSRVESQTRSRAAADKYLTSLWLLLFVSAICSLLFMRSDS